MVKISRRKKKNTYYNFKSILNKIKKKIKQLSFEYIREWWEKIMRGHKEEMDVGYILKIQRKKRIFI